MPVDQECLTCPGIPRMQAGEVIGAQVPLGEKRVCECFVEAFASLRSDLIAPLRLALCNQRADRRFKRGGLVSVPRCEDFLSTQEEVIGEDADAPDLRIKLARLGRKVAPEDADIAFERINIVLENADTPAKRINIAVEDANAAAQGVNFALKDTDPSAQRIEDCLFALGLFDGRWLGLRGHTVLLAILISCKRRLRRQSCRYHRRCEQGSPEDVPLCHFVVPG